ncbi:hypothetical protein FHG89_16955 [Micromonospora orduensis]|uniref:Uncharacterized protein n=1 Tax=Micromonospora orduensis TaxID=1420891 RepID=A0A5C4QNL7_9ACTN|nr:hypothetical protein [Micromonospora orduensis]TNH27799.1 hypothetical protein FHG89_16955 [Micromonospora orduensis]
MSTFRKASRRYALAIAALLVASGTGTAAWRMAANESVPTPRIQHPGTIAIAAVTANAQEPISVHVEFDGSVGVRHTRMTIVIDQERDPHAESTAPSRLLVFLCGSIAEAVDLQDKNGRKVLWQRTLLDGIYASILGSLSECVYSPVFLDGAAPFRQEILTGETAAHTSNTAASKVIYALPAVVPWPRVFSVNGLQLSQLPKGSEGEVQLVNPPSDLLPTFASPELPDSGVLRWGAALDSFADARNAYRLSGDLVDRHAAAQRDLFLAGALAGIAGGALVWCLELTLGALSRPMSDARGAGVSPQAGRSVRQRWRASSSTLTAGPMPWKKRGADASRARARRGR